jgi:hypothetical protein
MDAALNQANLASLASKIDSISKSAPGDVKKGVEDLTESVGSDTLKELVGQLSADGKFDKGDMKILKLFLDLLTGLEGEGKEKDALHKALNAAPGAATGAGAPAANAGPMPGAGAAGPAPSGNGAAPAAGGDKPAAGGNAPPAYSPPPASAEGKPPQTEASAPPAKGEAAGKGSDAKPADCMPHCKPEGKPDSTPADKAESKPEAKAEAKPEGKAEPKAEPKPEPKAEAKPEPKPEAKPEPKPEGKPESAPPSAERKAEQTYNKLEKTASGDGEVSANEKKALDMFAKTFDTKPAKADDDMTRVLREVLKTSLADDGKISDNEAAAIAGVIGAMGGKSSLTNDEVQDMLLDFMHGSESDGKFSDQDLATFSKLLSLVDSAKGRSADAKPASGNGAEAAPPRQPSASASEVGDPNLAFLAQAFVARMATSFINSGGTFGGKKTLGGESDDDEKTVRF